MELYSRKPPHIAPNKFAAIALERSPPDCNIVEKTIPEKNNGQVSKTTATSRPVVVGGNPPPSLAVKKNDCSVVVCANGDRWRSVEGFLKHEIYLAPLFGRQKTKSPD
jgi:hypothetical protein